jgi:hypothetical protein
MAASINQDFVTYQGNAISPIFTVKTAAGVAVDISTVTEITWQVLPEDLGTPLISKTKTGGGITFVTTGADGKFQVAILAADTLPLEGYYMHTASITDAGGNVTTVSVGRMQVGLKPTWTYNSAKLSTVPLFQVRRLIGDVLIGDQQMQDQEVQWYIDNYSNVWAAASAACRALAAQFSRMVDTVQGEMHTLYSQRAKNYMLLAQTLYQQSRGRGVAYVYAGGISQSDKQQQVEDSDRVPPQFNLLMFDDLLPESPVGHQTPASPGNIP